MFASGKHAVTHCQRCGFQYAYNDMQQEVGTKFWVCSACFDNMDLVNHPQNKSAKTSPDPIALRRPNPETPVETWETTPIPWNYFSLEWDEAGDI